MVNYYLEILLCWCALNFIITGVSWACKANMFHISMFYLSGIFCILIYGLIIEGRTFKKLSDAKGVEE